MHGSIPADPQRAIFPTAEVRKDFSGKSIVAEVRSEKPREFAKLARKLWPAKTAAVLQHLTGRKERQCYAWAAGESEPFASVLFTILQGSEGGRALEFIMRDSDAEWWQQHKCAAAKAEIIDGLKTSIEQLPFKFAAK